MLQGEGGKGYICLQTPSSQTHYAWWKLLELKRCLCLQEGDCKQGTPIKSGTPIRLQHMNTRRWLHSHKYPSPLSGNQEVNQFTPPLLCSLSMCMLHSRAHGSVYMPPRTRTSEKFLFGAW